MILVVMAAGMGSRFGGLKQLTPVGPSGEFIIDYSVYDAIKAGIEKVVFVIKEEHLKDFKETIGNRIESKIKVEYAFQKMDNIPEGFKVPEGRVKPWGTGHALLSAAPYIDKNFMIINADDFYGETAFKTLGDYLKNNENEKEYAMVAYNLKNTLSPNGTVSRGICQTENGYLKKVTERTKIGYFEGILAYQEDEKLVEISGDVPASMNMLGFTPKVLTDAKNYFIEFFEENKDELKGEFYLPTIVQKSIDENKATVKILNTNETWYGITYKEDLEQLQKYITKLIEEGVYPNNLWGN